MEGSGSSDDVSWPGIVTLRAPVSLWDIGVSLKAEALELVSGFAANLLALQREDRIRSSAIEAYCRTTVHHI